MQQNSLPPVPQKLRELLAEYPELIERLQEVLVTSAEKSRRIPLSPFDDAVWAIEGRLDSFFSEARRDLREAEENGNEQSIAAAKSKRSAISKAVLKQLWITDEGLLTYFQGGFK